MASGPKGNKKPRSIWLELEETELIKFLTKKKAEAGDRMNFKMATYKEAADMIAEYQDKGPAKDGAVVKRKWTGVHANMTFLFNIKDGDNEEDRLDDQDSDSDVCNLRLFIFSLTKRTYRCHLLHPTLSRLNIFILRLCLLQQAMVE